MTFDFSTFAYQYKISRKLDNFLRIYDLNVFSNMASVRHLVFKCFEFCHDFCYGPNLQPHSKWQAAPCVNGDTSFLWEPRVTFWIFSPQPYRSDPSADFHAKWLNRRGFIQASLARMCLFQ